MDQFILKTLVCDYGIFIVFKFQVPPNLHQWLEILEIRKKNENFLIQEKKNVKDRRVGWEDFVELQRKGKGTLRSFMLQKRNAKHFFAVDFAIWGSV